MRFEESLESGGKLNNLSIFYSDVSWTDDIDTATGKIVYEAMLEYDKTGISGVTFIIKSIEVELQTIKYDDDDNEEEIVREFVFDEDVLQKMKIDVNVRSLPWYIDEVTLDFTHSEDLDGEVILKDVKAEIEIGSAE
jgi:hypothetical protein